jgi:hypothetical protein
MKMIERAIIQTNEDIITEVLPTGHSSPIAQTLTYKETETGFRVIFGSRVWAWLNYGTGIHSGENPPSSAAGHIPIFKGAGPGGAIIPIHKKYLHFKNVEIAAALGFKTEEVFLKKVQGIRPRWFLDRYYFSSRFKDKIRPSG